MTFGRLWSLPHPDSMKTQPSVRRVMVGGSQRSVEDTRRTRRRSRERRSVKVGMRAPSITVGESLSRRAYHGIADLLLGLQNRVLAAREELDEVLGEEKVPRPVQGD